MIDDFEAALRALGWFRAGDGTWSTRYVDGNGWPAAPLVLIEPSPAFDAVRALCEYSREQGRREQQALLAEATKALERLESRRGEDVDQWAQRLAKDVGNATD